MGHVRNARLIAVALRDVLEGKQTATIRQGPRRYRDPSFAPNILEGDISVLCSARHAALGIDLVQRAAAKIAGYLALLPSRLIWLARRLRSCPLERTVSSFNHIRDGIGGNAVSPLT
jgi:hypothetical protein